MEEQERLRTARLEKLVDVVEAEQQQQRANQHPKDCNEEAEEPTEPDQYVIPKEFEVVS